MNIVASLKEYEKWLEECLNGDINRDDISDKHKKIAHDAFQFLRGTYWRWAETIYEAEVCPELKGAPQVLAVGDIHVENFGTWRDAEGRLVWGVNDFDEAARMPYAIDIVRLATSAVLADAGGDLPDKCLAVLEGYRDGLATGNPKPFLLDRENHRLRHIAIVSEEDRTEFWEKFDPDQIKLKIEKETKKGKRPKVRPAIGMRPRYRKAIEDARPSADVSFRFYERTAGTGSLGRPRYFGVGLWHGDHMVREAKAILPSGWVLAQGGPDRLLCQEIAYGRYRDPDPTYRLHGRVLVRRLSPNDFKIEAKEGDTPATADPDKPNAVQRSTLVDDRMLHAMGRDIALVHRGTRGQRKVIEVDLKARKTRWLIDAVTRARKKVDDDWSAWREHYRETEVPEVEKRPKAEKKKTKAKKTGKARARK